MRKKREKKLNMLLELSQQSYKLITLWTSNLKAGRAFQRQSKDNQSTNISLIKTYSERRKENITIYWAIQKSGQNYRATLALHALVWGKKIGEKYPSSVKFNYAENIFSVA